MTTEQAPDNSSHKGGDSSDRPPFFRSWSAIYAIVLSFLALLVFLFYIFTKAYS